MADEQNTETTNAGDTTQQEAAGTETTQAASTETAKVETAATAGEAKGSEADINNAVAAALRKRDIETARELLKAEMKPEPVDLSKYVPVEKFDEAVKQIGELKETFETDKHQLAVENIITRHGLSESDVELIQTDDLALFEKRAKDLAGRSNAAIRSAVVRQDIPDDMKGNEMYNRLMR